VVDVKKNQNSTKTQVRGETVEKKIMTSESERKDFGIAFKSQ